jgi:hypothetical protein
MRYEARMTAHPEPTQLDKFKEAARELECDEDEAAGMSG